MWWAPQVRIQAAHAGMPTPRARSRSAINPPGCFLTPPCPLPLSCQPALAASSRPPPQPLGPHSASHATHRRGQVHAVQDPAQLRGAGWVDAHLCRHGHWAGQHHRAWLHRRHARWAKVLALCAGMPLDSERQAALVACRRSRAAALPSGARAVCQTERISVLSSSCAGHPQLITLAAVEAPVDIEDGLPTEAPLVYYTGTPTPSGAQLPRFWLDCPTARSGWAEQPGAGRQCVAAGRLVGIRIQ